MQLSNILHTLLGAALVSIGFLLAMLAERLKAARADRTAQVSRPQPLRAPIPVVEPADLLRSTPAVKPARATRAEPKPAEPKADANTEIADEVINALVMAKHKRPLAVEATWACTAAERTTIESWMAAALRRCAQRGGLS